MATMLINLENGHPKVEAALTRLRLELATLRRIGVHTVKIIHGYGSSGVGGSIRQATRQLLCAQLNEGKIKAFCPGEHFGPFENAGRSMVSLAPVLRQDADWGRQNDGVTIVILH
jgi:hypothetical protein